MTCLLKKSKLPIKNDSVTKKDVSYVSTSNEYAITGAATWKHHKVNPLFYTQLNDFLDVELSIDDNKATSKSS